MSTSSSSTTSTSQNRRVARRGHVGEHDLDDAFEEFVLVFEVHLPCVVEPMHSKVLQIICLRSQNLGGKAPRHHPDVSVR
eukprot:CAMPEP_0180169410 /NCGR_PEP_ID=MMETSP0986-20121125/33251_1 /TAXON_ID=697907 /ORGANISM="non described non described, Strain CCMP2293" /LENGTH=79 /DNA_ID=CAMNT_0022120977 /DNA_START=30 /DNA_END=266 /DNA_ORIENTATION=+